VPFAINSSLKKDTLVLQSGISASLSEVDITIGRSKVVDLQAPVARVSISDPEVASAVIISPTQIQLIGKRVGVANLVLWDDETSSRYTILDIAVHRDVSVLAKQLKFLDPGIRVEPLAAQNSVVLSGDAQTAESAQLAVELAKAFFAQQGRGGAGGGAGAGGGGAAAGGGAGAGGAGGAAGGGGNQAQAISSLAPGSSLPLSSPRVINMIKVAGRPSTKLELARTKLKELDPNIRMDIVPGDGGAEKVILTGRVATAGTISKAINTASVFYGTPGMRVITGPGGKMIRPTGTADFQPANAFNDNLDINILQGSIVTDSSGNVISMMEVAQKPQVRCSIRFLNVQRAALAQLGGSLLMSRRDFALGSYSAGLNPLAGRTIVQQGGGSSYAATATGNYRGVPNPASKVVTEAVNLTQTLGTGVTQAFTINQTILGAISALEDRRKLRSLAEPTLTLLSGEKASFLAGGEVPIPVLGTNGQITINYHEFGIRLNLIATVTDDNKIHMQVAPEVSTVDPTNSITSNLVTVPGFATRRMQTTLEMVNGESFILAGLYSQEDSDNISRFPGIGQIPIIGTFFSGKNRDRRDNEMIVIIRPEIIMSPEAGATTTPVGNNPLKAPGQKFSKEILGLADTK
jgi:Flp pilus assembly secretin CpaC